MCSLGVVVVISPEELWRVVFHRSVGSLQLTRPKEWCSVLFVSLAQGCCLFRARSRQSRALCKALISNVCSQFFSLLLDGKPSSSCRCRATFCFTLSPTANGTWQTSFAPWKCLIINSSFAVRRGLSFSRCARNAKYALSSTIWALPTDRVAWKAWAARHSIPWNSASDILNQQLTLLNFKLPVAWCLETPLPTFCPARCCSCDTKSRAPWCPRIAGLLFPSQNETFYQMFPWQGNQTLAETSTCIISRQLSNVFWGQYADMSVIMLPYFKIYSKF